MNYDKTIQVGDYLTAYHKGIWQLTEIWRRFYRETDSDWFRRGHEIGEEYNPIFVYEKVMNADFSPVTGKRRKKECDASYCKKVTRESLRAEAESIMQTYEKAAAHLFGARTEDLSP